MNTVLLDFFSHQDEFVNVLDDLERARRKHEELQRKVANLDKLVADVAKILGKQIPSPPKSNNDDESIWEGIQ